MQTTSVGLILIDSHPNITKTRVKVSLYGIIEVVPGPPFYLLVANFAERRAHLPKHMLVAIGTGAPQYVVHLTHYNFDLDNNNEKSPTADEVNAEH